MDLIEEQQIFDYGNSNEILGHEELDVISGAGKIFIGGVSWQTTKESIKHHFEKYGEIAFVAIMTDKMTGTPRGFAFVTFTDPAVADIAVAQTHTIDGRVVDVKKAVSRSEVPVVNKPESRKLFVGGLLSEVTQTDMEAHFSQYGQVIETVVMIDRSTSRSRGFGFVIFANEEAVVKCINTPNEILGKWVEIKRAEPRQVNSGLGQGYSGQGSMNMGGGGRMNSMKHMYNPMNGQMHDGMMMNAPAHGGHGGMDYPSNGYPGYAMNYGHPDGGQMPAIPMYPQHIGGGNTGAGGGNSYPSPYGSHPHQPNGQGSYPNPSGNGMYMPPNPSTMMNHHHNQGPQQGQGYYPHPNPHHTGHAGGMPSHPAYPYSPPYSPPQYPQYPPHINNSPPQYHHHGHGMGMDGGRGGGGYGQGYPGQQQYGGGHSGQGRGNYSQRGYHGRGGGGQYSQQQQGYRQPYQTGYGGPEHGQRAMHDPYYPNGAAGVVNENATAAVVTYHEHESVPALHTDSDAPVTTITDAKPNPSLAASSENTSSNGSIASDPVDLYGSVNHLSPDHEDGRVWN